MEKVRGLVGMRNSMSLAIVGYGRVSVNKGRFRVRRAMFKMVK